MEVLREEAMPDDGEAISRMRRTEMSRVFENNREE